jgi:hypothetical protein
VELRENVSADITYGDLDCSLRKSQFMRGAESLVFFEVSINPSQLKFEEAGDDVEESKVDVFCEVLDTSDQYQVDSLDETLTLSRTSEQDTQDGSLTSLEDRFRIPAGEHELRCLVQDVKSRKVGESRAPISVPDMEPSNLVMSSLVLTQVVQESTLTDSEDEEALLFQRLRFPQISDQQLDPGRPVLLFFEVYGEPTEPKAGPSLSDEPPKPEGRIVFDYRIYNDEQVFLKVPFQKLEWKQKADRFSQALQFDLSKLPPGEYTFLVKVVDVDSKSFAIETAAFQVMEAVAGKGGPGVGSQEEGAGGR